LSECGAEDRSYPARDRAGIGVDGIPLVLLDAVAGGAVLVGGGAGAGDGGADERADRRGDRSQAASARSSAANVEIVTAIISACRPFNNFGFADFISILNSGQNSHRRVAGIDLSGAIQRLSERRTDAHGGSTQNNL